MQNLSEQDIQNIAVNYYNLQVQYQKKMNRFNQLQALLEGLSISKSVIE